MRLLIVLVFLNAAGGVLALPRVHVDPTTGHFVDTTGRVRIFRGINSVIKGFPWYDERMLDDKRLDTLQEAGFNVVRLGAMWTGVQPDGPNSHNQTYVNILKTIIVKLSDRGIYTLLDTHQDVLWKGGEHDDRDGYWGVPPWIKHALPTPEHFFPWPLESIKLWPCGYATQEISRGFQLIYENVNQTRDKFAAFWKLMATLFKDEPSVLGYELINEPFAGDIHDNLRVMLPGVTGKEFLAPMYEQAHSAIREVDEETIVFWEPITWGYAVPYNPKKSVSKFIESTLKQFTVMDFQPVLEYGCGKFMDNATAKTPADEMFSKFLYLTEQVTTMFNAVKEDLMRPFSGRSMDSNSSPSIFGPGFTTPPGGTPYLNRTAMSWHYYCWALHINEGTDADYDPTLKALCDDFLGPMQFGTVRQRASEMGGSGTMLTEFGLCRPNVTLTQSQSTVECKFVIDQMEHYLESWVYWDTATGTAFWNDSGDLIVDMLKVFSRPYPMNTAGTPYDLSFDIYTREFFFEFFPSVPKDFSGYKPTEIFVPPMHFPGASFEVELSSDLSWEFALNCNDLILVSATLSSQKTAKSWVRISPQLRVPRIEY